MLLTPVMFRTKAKFVSILNDTRNVYVFVLLLKLKLELLWPRTCLILFTKTTVEIILDLTIIVDIFGCTDAFEM